MNKYPTKIINLDGVVIIRQNSMLPFHIKTNYRKALLKDIT